MTPSPPPSALRVRLVASLWRSTVRRPHGRPPGAIRCGPRRLLAHMDAEALPRRSRCAGGRTQTCSRAPTCISARPATRPLRAHTELRAAGDGRRCRWVVGARARVWLRSPVRCAFGELGSVWSLNLAQMPASGGGSSPWSSDSSRVRRVSIACWACCCARVLSVAFAMCRPSSSNAASRICA